MTIAAFLDQLATIHFPNTPLIQDEIRSYATIARQLEEDARLVRRQDALAASRGIVRDSLSA